MMVVQTRKSIDPSKARPNREQRLENAALRSRVRKSIEKAQQEEAFKELIKAMASNGGKADYGAIKKIVKAYQSNGFKAVTRQNLYYRLSKMRNANDSALLGATVATTSSETQGVISDITGDETLNEETVIDGSSKIGGRKKGTTKEKKEEAAQNYKEVIKKCAILYDKAVKEARTNGLANVPSGTLKKIVNEEEEKAGLSINSISIETVRSRVKRGNPDGGNENQLSPIRDMEPIICDFCIRLGKMGCPLTKTTIIELANDLIMDTEYTERIAECKKLRKLKGLTKLGNAWYRGFLLRYEKFLTRNGSAIKDAKRSTWVTRENFQNMYENVYERMVEAGIAKKEDIETVQEDGLPSKYSLTLPEYLIFLDETGCNTNQMNDGKVGGEVFILPKNSGDAAAPIGATTDIHFTVLPFISGTGVPVLCAIIFKSELSISEIPLSWKLGIDIAVSNEEANNMEKVARSGPTCFFRGKEIPCFYGTSPKASITSQLLADMLKYLDQLGLYDRSVAYPFLLLDGHHSRMMRPFLEYINDPEHKWVACFGVPYATHVWQVADASSLNGCFKIELTKAKQKYLQHRSKPKFEPTDIVPLVNMAFPKSFGNQENARKAIASRGWNPLNYKILTTLPEKEVYDLTTEVSGDKTGTTTTISVPISLNISSGSGSYYLDKLIEEERKQEGRKRKFETLKLEQDTKEKKIEHIKTLTKVSSATLAANNHYTLDENILEIVIQKEAADIAARKATEERKRAAETKRAESLKKALEKFTFCPNGLTVPELKALVTATTNVEDSPVKNKKADLQRQIYGEPRHSRVQAMASNLRLTLAAEEAGTNTSNNVAAEALLSLVALTPTAV